MTITIMSKVGGTTRTTYSVNKGASAPVTSEQTTGSLTPYTCTIEIDELSISADAETDLAIFHTWGENLKRGRRISTAAEVRR